MATFTDSVRFAQAPFLVQLLQLRPDLASPSPGTLFSLGARATNSHSLTKAIAALTAVQLQALEAVAVLASISDDLSLETVVHAIIGPDTGSQSFDHAEQSQTISQALDHLLALALVWQPSAGHYLTAPGVPELLDRFPAGFGPITPAAPVIPLPNNTPPTAHSILDAMLWGPPVGLVPANLMEAPEFHQESATPSALRWLLKHQYLELLDPTHISLPRQVAYALRGNRTHKGLSQPPRTADSAAIAEAQIQAEATGAAEDLVRQVADLIELWESQPCPALRSGGLPVREVKAIATKLDLPVEQVQATTEAAFAARLIRASDPSPHVFAPTVAADNWLGMELGQRWQFLVYAWLNSPRLTWQIGKLDDRAQTIAALSPTNHENWVVRLRAAVLKTLAQFPNQALSAQDIAAQLQWQTPRAQISVAAVEGILAECHRYGVTGAGALLPGLLVPDSKNLGWQCEPARALETALPSPVREIFIQGDLTAMVPGRPVPALETLLAECARVESRGGALTVRFTPDSITHAFDSGRSAQGLLSELQMYSVTPIPQALEYLISDCSRKHGRVRVGTLTSYIRISDPVALAAILASPARATLGAFQLAPDLLGATADLSQVLHVLREAQLAPAVEDHEGNLITADRLTPQTRLPSAPLRPESAGGLPQHPMSPATIFAHTHLKPQPDLPALVEQLIAATVGDLPISANSLASLDGSKNPAGTQVPSLPEVPTGHTITFLREAISNGAEVWIELVDSAGRTSRRKLKPLSIDSGRLRAADLVRESELTVSVHRIASAQPVETED